MTPAVRELAPPAAHAARANLRFLDVREADERTGELGHLAGSEHVPLAAVPDRLRAWDRATPIVVVCRSGARSARAAQALVAAGFGCVFNLAGGMLAVHAAGLGGWTTRDAP